MPIGTLKEALLFPDHMIQPSDGKLKQWLRDCGLAYLENELYHVSIWSERLSPGELQRIALVRILLHQLIGCF